MRGERLPAGPGAGACLGGGSADIISEETTATNARRTHRIDPFLLTSGVALNAIIVPAACCGATLSRSATKLRLPVYRDPRGELPATHSCSSSTSAKRLLKPAWILGALTLESACKQ